MDDFHNLFLLGLVFIPATCHRIRKVVLEAFDLENWQKSYYAYVYLFIIYINELRGSFTTLERVRLLTFKLA